MKGVFSHWTEMFDVIITSAHKPLWFTKKQPFRSFDPKSHLVTWEKIAKFEPGKIYIHGSLEVGDKLIECFINNRIVDLFRNFQQSQDGKEIELFTLVIICLMI